MYRYPCDNSVWTSPGVACCAAMCTPPSNRRWFTKQAHEARFTERRYARRRQVFFHVRHVLHANQRRRDAQCRADELQRALRIGIEIRDDLAQRGWQAPAQLPLEKGCTRHHRYAEMLRGGEQRYHFAVEALAP